MRMKKMLCQQQQDLPTSLRVFIWGTLLCKHNKNSLLRDFCAWHQLPALCFGSRKVRVKLWQLLCGFSLPPELEIRTARVNTHQQCRWFQWPLCVARGFNTLICDTSKVSEGKYRFSSAEHPDDGNRFQEGPQCPEQICVHHHTKSSWVTFSVLCLFENTRSGWSMCIWILCQWIFDSISLEHSTMWFWDTTHGHHWSHKTSRWRKEHPQLQDKTFAVPLARSKFDYILMVLCAEAPSFRPFEHSCHAHVCMRTFQGTDERLSAVSWATTFWEESGVRSCSSAAATSHDTDCCKALFLLIDVRCFALTEGFTRFGVHEHWHGRLSNFLGISRIQNLEYLSPWPVPDFSVCCSSEEHQLQCCLSNLLPEEPHLVQIHLIRSQIEGPRRE